MIGEFAGRSALVTGGGSGLGRATALKLAAGGAMVAVVDLLDERARCVADEIRSAGGQALAIAGDVGSASDVEVMVAATVDGFGRLDLAFNNAGIGGPPRGPIQDASVDEYLRLMDVNLHSVFYCLKYEIPQMLAAGGGAIVNMSSVMGLIGTDMSFAYVAAKHGVTGLTKAAALQVADNGIRVNSVHPGYIETPLVASMEQSHPDRFRGIVGKHPIGRLGSPEEVAALVLFLLSDRASFITGSQYTIDGGYTAQ